MAKFGRTIPWALLVLILLFFSVLFPKVLHRRAWINPKGRFETKVSEIYSDAAPVPLELGAPKSLVMHTHITSFLWYSRSYTLLCRYDEDAYAAEKAALETRYSFRTEPLFANSHEKYPIEPTLTLGTINFDSFCPRTGIRTTTITFSSAA